MTGEQSDVTLVRRDIASVQRVQSIRVVVKVAPGRAIGVAIAYVLPIELVTRAEPGQPSFTVICM